LTQTSGTAEIFRAPEVQAAITQDFIILPCDLVCELEGSSLMDAWMLHEAGFGAATGGLTEENRVIGTGLGGEKLGRRGGLGVWYQTKGENSVKGEDTDFIATTPLSKPIVPPPVDSLSRDISQVVLSMPTDALKDVIEEEKGLPIRHALLRKNGRIKTRTSFRDAHLYFFPYWLKEWILSQEKFDSLSEDVLGWWAKACWQDGLADKLGLRGILQKPASTEEDGMDGGSGLLEEQIDLTDFISTWSPPPKARMGTTQRPSVQLASRVQDPNNPSAELSIDRPATDKPLAIPPLLAYIQPAPVTSTTTTVNQKDSAEVTQSSQPLIHRVDTAPLVLHLSLLLARLPPSAATSDLSDPNPPIKPDSSPLAFPHKVHPTTSIPQKCRVETENSLLDANVSVAERCNIKESVIGRDCIIGAGAKVIKSVLFEGVEIGENVQISGCVLGRRCKIEGGTKASGKGKGSSGASEGTTLRDCEVQEGWVVEWGSKSYQFHLSSNYAEMSIRESIAEQVVGGAGLRSFLLTNHCS
jgi:translation initiation factor eIF-2B subunit gamma